LAGVGVLSDPTALGNDRLLTAAREIWDRGGLIKQDGLQLGGAAVGILILPSKDEPEDAGS
jgi:hypothetical protein